MKTSNKEKLWGRLVILLALVVGAFGFIPARAQERNDAELRAFDLLTDSSGWILLDQTLWRTSDAGATWQDISPALPADAAIRDVRFLNLNEGWVLFTTPDPAGGARFHLAHTGDGLTWTMRELPLFEPGEIASYAERAQMGWLDAQTGWIAVKQMTGSNFSLGALFVTSDGGGTWTRSALPVAEQVYFSDAQNGWALGGPSGGDLFKTSDGGATWQDAAPGDAERFHAALVSGDDGMLLSTDADRLNVYWLAPSGAWSLTEQAPLDTEPGLPALSILDPRNFLAIIPGTRSILRMEDGRLDSLSNLDGLSASVTMLDMVSLETGWAKSVEATCSTASFPTSSSATVTCTSTTRLLRTSDGGQTWQSVPLPSLDSTRVTALNSASQSSTVSAQAGAGNTQIQIGQGFDACEIPSLNQMRTWAENSPYKAVNLYIGGSSRACDNLALDATFIKQLYFQGWSFIPTWVGPQAPCTGYLTRMSSDPATAYTQGVTQADLASDKLAQLGLTCPDGTGSIVYYDIEYYGTDSACRSAVNSFMNGWVTQLRARGNLSGIYATHACNTGLNDFHAIANPPDAVWIAGWYYNIGDPRGTYDPTASVWDWLSSCMSNTYWANHQRIRQYSGDHNETWGGLTLNIDNDVLDGIVALPYLTPPPRPITPTPQAPRPKPVMKSDALTPTALTSDFGTTNGSLPSLSLLQQTGADDDPAAYVSFQTPNTVYMGTQSFLLPADARADLIASMLLQVNFKGASSQVWTWSIYNWRSGLWIELGDSIGTAPDQWSTRLFKISNPRLYVSSRGEIRIQLKSDNASGDAKIDYEALHLTYLSIPATATPLPTPSYKKGGAYIPTPTP